VSYFGDKGTRSGLCARFAERTDGAPRTRTGEAHLGAMSESGSARWGKLCSRLEEHGAGLLKQESLSWNHGGLGASFIVSRKRRGFVEVRSGKRILLLVGFGSGAVRKAASRGTSDAFEGRSDEGFGRTQRGIRFS